MVESEKSVDESTPRNQQDNVVVVAHTVQDAIDLIGNGKVQFCAVLASILCLMSYVVDTLGFGLVLPAATCDLELDTYSKGLLSSAPFLGFTISAHAWGFLADFMGRRKTICISLSLSLCFSFVAAIAPTFWLILSLRFFSGLSLSGATSAMYPYIGELLTSTTRSKFMTLVGYAMGAGTLYSTAIGWALQRFQVELRVTEGYTLHPWRIQMICALLPGLVAVLIYNWLPESPKFFVAIGRSDRALKTLQYIHETNGHSGEDLPVRNVLQEVSSSAKRTLATFINSMLHETKSLFQIPCLWPMLGSCFIQYVLFMVSAGFLIWYPEITNRLKSESGPLRLCDVFTSRKVTHAMLNNTSVSPECPVQIPDKVYIDSLAIALGYIVTNTIIYCSHIKIPLLYITMSSMTLSCLSAFLLPSLSNEWMIVVSFVCFITGCSVGISIFNVLLVEIFPNFLCGMAISLALLTGRISTFVATSVLGILLEQHCEVTIYGTGLLVVAAITCLYCLPKKIQLSR